MNFTNEDIMYIKNVFYQDGYVLDFSDKTFAEFTLESIEIDIKSKYGFSKGKSLLLYFSDKNVNIQNKVKLLKDLVAYYPVYKAKSCTFGIRPATDPAVNAIINNSLKRCHEIVKKYSGMILTTSTTDIPEKGLKELIEEAQEYYKKDKKVAVEKIWDALDRLKTYYLSEGMDKKKSSELLIKKMSHNDANFYQLFSDEFLYLKNIGNDFRIRHHETNKIDIIDDNYYEYFFNRCLSLIDLSLKYLDD